MLAAEVVVDYTTYIGGKSLTYQVPALCLPVTWSHVLRVSLLKLFQGLTLVISPLIALMKDQVDALVSRGVKAANLDSTLDAARSSWVKEEVISGRLKLLYVAPERFAFKHITRASLTPFSRLNNEGFIAMMSHVKISLLAIDESHCISQVCLVMITFLELAFMSGV